MFALTLKSTVNGSTPEYTDLEQPTLAALIEAYAGWARLFATCGWTTVVDAAIENAAGVRITMTGTARLDPSSRITVSAVAY